MKKMLFGLVTLSAIITFAFAYSKGDTVYTCHWEQDGWMWLGGHEYACPYIVLEKLGSRYRVEALEDYCDTGVSEGDVKIMDSGYLFSPDAVEDNGHWHKECKAEYYK